MSTLDEIIRMAVFAADSAILVREPDRQRTLADVVREAVRAGITCAVDNGLLTVADDADQRLAAGIVTYRGTDPS